MRDNEQNIIGATGSLLPASCVTLITEFLVILCRIFLQVSMASYFYNPSKINYFCLNRAD